MKQPATDTPGKVELLKPITAVATIRLIGLMLAFLASIVLARSLGASGYGTYSYALALISIIAVPASLGLPTYLLKQTSRTRERSRALQKWAIERIHYGGAAAAAFLVLAYFILGEHPLALIALMASPIPWLTNLVAIRQSTIQAFGKVTASQWPFLILPPLTTVLFSSVLWISPVNFSVAHAISIHLAALLITLSVQQWQQRSLHQPHGDASIALASLRQALPFLWLNGLFLLNNRLDLIVLGSLHGSEDTGTYAIASRLAELSLFFLTITNTTIAHRIAPLHQNSQKKSLEVLAKKSARNIIALSIGPCLILIVGAPFILSLLYGEEYASGVLPLQILVGTYAICSLTGPVGILLNMTDHAKASIIGFAAGTLTNLLLLLILVPNFGMLGAAASTAIGALLCASVRLIMVRRLLDIDPTPL